MHESFLRPDHCIQAQPHGVPMGSIGLRNLFSEPKKKPMPAATGAIGNQRPARQGNRPG